MEIIIWLDKKDGEIYLNDVSVLAWRRDAGWITQSKYESVIGPATKTIFKEATRDVFTELFSRLFDRYKNIKLSGSGIFKKVLDELQYYGYGIPELVFFDEKIQAAKIRIHHCFNTAGYHKKNEKPICYIMEGILTSLFEVYFQGRVNCKETKCAAMGHPYCEFRIYSLKSRFRFPKRYLKPPRDLVTVRAKYNPKKGTISHNNMDTAFFPRRFNKRLELESEKIIGPATKGIWYSFGRHVSLDVVGKNFLKGILLRLVTKLKKDIFISKLERINGEFGFGILEWRDVNINNKTAEMRLYNSSNAEGVEDSKKPVCYLMSGLYAGANDVIFGRTMLTEEVKCKGMGDPYCEFKVHKFGE